MSGNQLCKPPIKTIISSSPLLFWLSGLNLVYLPTICFTFYPCLTHGERFPECWQLLSWPCAAGLVKVCQVFVLTLSQLMTRYQTTQQSPGNLSPAKKSFIRFLVILISSSINLSQTKNIQTLSADDILYLKSLDFTQKLFY